MDSYESTSLPVPLLMPHCLFIFPDIICFPAMLPATSLDSRGQVALFVIFCGVIYVSCCIITLLLLWTVGAKLQRSKLQ